MRVHLLLVAATATLAVAGCDFVGEPYHAKNPRPFNSQEWKAAADDTRCDMVDDLRNSVGLEGKTRAELIAMLGEPETHGNPPDHYHLCPSFMDVWILEIHWKDGRVASTNIRDT